MVGTMNQAKGDNEEKHVEAMMQDLDVNVCKAFEGVFDMLSLLSSEYQKLKQQRSVSTQPISNNKNQKADFTSMLKVSQSVIRLQSWFRKELVQRKLQKQLKDSRAALSSKKQTKTPEEQALKEFSQQLQNKKVTPEGFYRLCDMDYKQSVRIDIFKDQLVKLGVKLSKGQLSRLTMILDESMDGVIVREQFYNALEAYHVSGEKHKSLDGQIYHPFEHRALFKLIVQLKKKNIQFIEMFNACDVNDESRVGIQDIKRFVEGLSHDFQVKEVHALINYLDIDKNSIIEKDDFLRQMTKGEQTYKQTQMLNKQIQERSRPMSAATGSFNQQANGSLNLANSFARAPDNNLFQEVEMGGGDQAFNPALRQSSTSKQSTSQGYGSDSADELKKKRLIAKMEKEGTNLNSFFKALSRGVVDGLIPLGSVLKSLETSYPTISLLDRNFLLRDCTAGVSKVDFAQLQQQFSKYSQSLAPNSQSALQVIAANIITRMGLGGEESIRQFFKAQNLGDTDHISSQEFANMFAGSLSGFGRRELEQTFSTLTVDQDGFLQVQDLIESLLSFATLTSKPQVSVDILSSIVPGFESLSPRSRCEEVISYLVQELDNKGLQPINIFKLADSKNSGVANLSTLQSAFKKLLPLIKNEVFYEALNAFRANGKKDSVTRDDFETVFNRQSTQRVKYSQAVVSKNTPSKQNPLKDSQSSNNNYDPDDAIAWIRMLDNALLREGISPSVAFKASDINHNGVVTLDELRDTIKRFLSENSLSLVQLSNVMKAFDQNRNGLIEEDEFISAFERARNARVTIVQTPDKGTFETPSKGSQLDPKALANQMGELDQKLNLKKVFGTFQINEQGRMACSTVSRGLKTVQADDGTELRPSDYAFLIKALDPSGVGLFDVKSLLALLEKNCSSFATDCTLELRMIANYIEIVMDSKNTANYLMRGKTFKPGQRIMEVEMVSQLSKEFGVSMQSSRLIFQKLDKLREDKKIKEVTLESLSNLIDQYRLTAVSQTSEVSSKTQSQKLDGEPLLLKYAVNIVGLPARRRTLYDGKVNELLQGGKSIEYKLFFEFFSENLQLLTASESKALFEYLKKYSKEKNTIDAQSYAKRMKDALDQVREAQEEAIREGFANFGSPFFEQFSKLKMDAQGYLSRSSIKTLLESYNCINSKGAAQQDSNYSKAFRQILNLPSDFNVNIQLQASEYIDSLLPLEQVEFWTGLEFLSRLTNQVRDLNELIFRHLGKLCDLAVPNKPTFSLIQSVASQCQTISGPETIVVLCESILNFLMTKGVKHGDITEECENQLGSMFASLGGKKILISNDENIFIQSINRHRALLPQGKGQNNHQPTTSVAQPNFPQMISQLEQVLGHPFENVISDFYVEDQINALTLQKFIKSANPSIDGKLLQSICMSLDTTKQGKILISDAVIKLSAIPGKYDPPSVLMKLIDDIGDLDEFLSSDSISAGEYYFKNDFLEILSQHSNLSRFLLLAIFYDIRGQDQSDSISGKLIIQKLKSSQSNPLKKSAQKKGVSFSQSNTSDQACKDLCHQFVDLQKQVVLESVITKALSTICQIMKAYKTQNDAVGRFDSAEGSGFLMIDQLKSKLDEVKGLSNEEKLALVFLPIGQVKEHVLKINLQTYVNLLRLLKFNDKSTIQQNLGVLAKNQEVVRKFLGLPLVSQQPQKSSQPSIESARSGDADIDIPASVPKEKRAEYIYDVKRARAIMPRLDKVLPALRTGLADSKKKAALIQLFNQDPEDQSIEVSEFSDFVENVLQVTGPEEQLDLLIDTIDEHEKGQIELGDFLEFCEFFGIDFKANLKKAKTQELHGELYKLIINKEEIFSKIIDPKVDYYRGIPTILNSLEAAVLVAEKLYNSIPKGEDFFDHDFGPKSDDDIEGIKKALYCTGVQPKGYVDPEDVEFISPDEGITDQQLKFIDGGAAFNDVKQGQIGDCWFIGALSVIATREDLLRGCLGDSVTDYTNLQNVEITDDVVKNFCLGVYAPIFHYYRTRRLYVFRFMKDLEWKFVIIDDRLPVFKSNQQPIFGQCRELNELWVPLIEKAYAKLHGCYETLISGFIDDGLSEMTGLVAEKILLHNEQNMFPHKNLKDKDIFWEYIMQRVKEGSMMGCSVVGDVEREIMIDGQKSGIMTGHAYGILHAFELPDPSMKNPRKTHRILMIRNPWGQLEWKGKWSDGSDECKKYIGLIRKYVATLPEEDKFEPNDDDGTFLINYSSWRDIYNNMYICCDFPKSWTGIRFSSEWTKDCSFGVPSPMTEENKTAWAKNPQYLFECKQDFEIFISLAQSDGRAQRSNGKYYKFPYSECIYPAIFTIVELDNGQKSVVTFDKNKIKGTSVLKPHKEVSLRLKLPKGRYVIIPSTRSKGQLGAYYLSIYVDQPLKRISCKRIDKHESYTAIAEETENAEAEEEQWKIDVTQARLNTIIHQTDDSLPEDSSFLKAAKEKKQDKIKNRQQQKQGGGRRQADDDDVIE